MKTSMVTDIEQEDLEQTKYYLRKGKIAPIVLCTVLLIISYKKV